MSGSTSLFVTLAGGAGVCARLRVDRGTQRVLSSWDEPMGAKLDTLVVSAVGCFLTGTVIQLVPADFMSIAPARFLGGFTTFSTAFVDTVTLWTDGFRGRGFALALGMWVTSWGVALTSIACAEQSFAAQLGPLCGLMSGGLATIRSLITVFRTLTTPVPIC